MKKSTGDTIVFLIISYAILGMLCVVFWYIAIPILIVYLIISYGVKKEKQKEDAELWNKFLTSNSSVSNTTLKKEESKTIYDDLFTYTIKERGYNYFINGNVKETY